MQLPTGFRLHPVFHVDNLKPAESTTPLRVLPVDAVDDDTDYLVDRAPAGGGWRGAAGLVEPAAAVETPLAAPPPPRGGRW